MTASIEFKSDQNTPISALNGVKIINLNDREGNTYTLDATDGNLKLKYKPYGQDEVEYALNGLAAALRSLLDIKSGNYDDTGKEITVLEEKVAEKPIVEAILYAKDDDNNRVSDTVLMHTFARRDDVSVYINSKLKTKADKDELDKKADTDNVYTKEEIDNRLEAKANTCDVCTKKEINDKLETKANIDNVYTKEDIDERLIIKANAHDVYTKGEANEKFFPLAEHRALAQDILRKRIDGGSILIKTLGEFLDEEHAWYGSERSQTAKDFLAEKGKFIKTDGSNVKIPDFTDKILRATENIEENKKGSIAKKFSDEKDMQEADRAQKLGMKQAQVIAQESITDKITELGSSGAVITKLSVGKNGISVNAIGEEATEKIPSTTIEGGKVEKSGELLDASDQAYENSVEIAKDENFIKDVTTMVVSDPIFQEAVEGVVSQQIFGVLSDYTPFGSWE